MVDSPFRLVAVPSALASLGDSLGDAFQLTRAAILSSLCLYTLLVHSVFFKYQLPSRFVVSSSRQALAPDVASDHFIVKSMGACPLTSGNWTCECAASYYYIWAET